MSKFTQRTLSMAHIDKAHDIINFLTPTNSRRTLSHTPSFPVCQPKLWPNSTFFAIVTRSCSSILSHTAAVLLSHPLTWYNFLDTLVPCSSSSNFPCKSNVLYLIHALALWVLRCWPNNSSLLGSQMLAQHHINESAQTSCLPVASIHALVVNGAYLCIWT